MSYDSSQWDDNEVDVWQIELDPENPRLDPHFSYSETAIFKYLYEHEGLLPLAKSIVSYGAMYPHERVICVPKEDGYIVIEGNRRLAAIKLLLKPNWITDFENITRSVEIPILSDQIRSNIQSVPISIAATREIADEVVAQLHIEELAKHPWNVRRKMRYAANRSSSGTSIDKIAHDLVSDTAKIYELIKFDRAFDTVIALDWSEREKDILWDDSLRLQIFFDLSFHRENINYFGHPIFEESGRLNYNFDKSQFILKKFAEHALISQKENTEFIYNRQIGIKNYLQSVFPNFSISGNKNQGDLFVRKAETKTINRYDKPYNNINECNNDNVINNNKNYGSEKINNLSEDQRKIYNVNQKEKTNLDIQERQDTMKILNLQLSKIVG